MAEKKTFLLRISPELWADLNRWAADELRSVNGQIEYILRSAAEERKGSKPGGSRDGSGDSAADCPGGGTSPPEADEHP